MHPWKSFLSVAAALLVAAVACRAPAAENVGRAVFKQTVPAVALVRGSDGQATGWLADREHKLLVTSRRAVGDAGSVTVLFPVFEDGRLVPERRYYETRGTPLPGDVLFSSAATDLAVIELESVPEAAAELRLAAAGAEPGQRIHMVGHADRSESLWLYSAGTVRQVLRREAGPDFSARVVESQLPASPLSNGAPVVNDAGEVVAVHTRANDGLLVSVAVDVSEVKEVLARAVRLADPVTAEDFVGRAKRHTARKDYRKAVADYTRAVELDPKLVAAYAGRAWVRNELKDFARAVEDCDEVLALDPENLAAYTERGYAFLEQGDYGKAIADLSQAVRLAPERAAAYGYRALAYLGKKEFEKAIDDFGTVVLYEQQNATTYNGRGKAYLGLSKFEDAVRDFDRAIEWDEKYAEAYANRAAAKKGLGQAEEARADLAKAIELDPDNAARYRQMVQK